MISGLPAAILIFTALVQDMAPDRALPTPLAEPAFTAEEDLDCAIYVGALMAEMGSEMTPDNRVGLTSALTYFVGRYEAQRGLALTEAFLQRYPTYRDRNPAEIEQTCSVRMRAFSVRLQQAGGALSRAEPEENRASSASQ